jgi:glycosyltransferase involved in cell wall biosynthesis
MVLPLISICIPLYKAQSYLRDTLNSLAIQSYSDFEVILVNDGDKSDYEAILQEFKHLNIQYHYQENEGAGAARNKAFFLSKGDYIKFMDADDLISADTLLAQIKLAFKNPGHIISGTWGRFFDDDLNTFEPEIESIYKDCDGRNWIIESWVQGPNMTQPGIFLIPRQLILTNGLWKEELSKGPCDDLEFFTRMILSSAGIKFCDNSTLYYRSGHFYNLSGLKSKESFEWYLETVSSATSYLLKPLAEDKKAKEAAAVQFTILAFKAFPYHPTISRTAFLYAEQLGGCNYHFPAGGFTKLLNTFIGWKNTIRLKRLLGYTKFN